MTPDERPLETLKKYGEQAREVQLTLHRNEPSAWEETSRTKVGRYQPCPPLRRKDPGARMRRGSGSLSLQRQSLPQLAYLKEEAEQDLQKTKRKSLTLMEEAWEWLESLGKGKVYSTASDKQRKKRTEKRNRASLDLTLSVERDATDRRGKVRGQKTPTSDLDYQTSCCIGNQTNEKESKHSKKTQEVRSDSVKSNGTTNEDEKNRVRETIVQQLRSLQDLQAQISHTDKRITELEERHEAKRAERENRERSVDEQTEQLRFWEDELKAEEDLEKDLQHQFLELKAKAGECKAQLEECKHKMQGVRVFGGAVNQEDPETAAGVGANAETPAGSAKDENLGKSDSDVDANVNRKFLPSEEPNPPPPQALVPPNQIKERRLTGPTEIKEWWTRWSDTQNAQTPTKKVIHRSELTIYLGSTKV